MFKAELAAAGVETLTPNQVIQLGTGVLQSVSAAYFDRGLTDPEEGLDEKTSIMDKYK